MSKYSKSFTEDLNERVIRKLRAARDLIPIGRQTLVRIIRAADGWRACRISESSSFGLPISPVGMNAFREVRDWARAYLV